MTPAATARSGRLSASWASGFRIRWPWCWGPWGSTWLAGPRCGATGRGPRLRGDEPVLGRQLRGLLLRLSSDLEQGRASSGNGGTLLSCRFRPVRSTISCRSFWQMLNIFNSPAWILTPLGVLRVGVARAGVLLWSVQYRWAADGPAVFTCCSGPVLITLLASALHQYPFHGRLLLFLVPTIHLLVGEGAATLGRPGGAVLVDRAGRIACSSSRRARTIWNQFIVHRFHGAYDSHGDLAPDLLDYLEKPKLDNPTPPPAAASNAGSNGVSRIAIWFQDGQCEVIEVLIEGGAGHPKCFFGGGTDA